jgi:GNAT superfamily N-acetyltransferase
MPDPSTPASGPARPARVAGEADLETVTEIIRLSFGDDPVWGRAFPPELGEAARSAIWRLDIGSALRLRWTWLSAGAEATSVWVPPGEMEIDPATEAEYLALLVARLGSGVERVFDLLARYEANHPRDEPHYYLSLLGTHPDHRGHGHGMRLLAENLALIDAGGMPAFLESTNPANNARYETVGFEVTGGFEGYTPGSVITTMWRSARR